MATIIFDNAGGVTLQLDGFAHLYQDPKQAARDYADYLNDGTTEGWDGHEEESAELNPTDDEIRNGGYRVYYDLEDILEAAEDTSWGNIRDFATAIWPDVMDSEGIRIDKNDVLSNGSDYIIASYQTLETLGNGAEWRVVGSLLEGESLPDALKRIDTELMR